jgi:hypothetical protein
MLKLQQKQLSLHVNPSLLNHNHGLNILEYRMLL